MDAIRKIEAADSEAADARREVGKWLNEGTNKPVDREALAQLCAGFDTLARPQEVAAPDELAEAVADVLERAPCDCPHKMRHEDGRHLSECFLFDLNIAASRAPEAVRAEPVAWHVDHRDSCQFYTSLVGLDLTDCIVSPLYTAPPKHCPGTAQRPRTWSGCGGEVKSLLQIMIGSAVQIVNREGDVLGYEIKTGAIHKLVGLCGLSIPINLDSRVPSEPGTDPIEYGAATPAAEQGDAKDARLEYCYQKAMGVLLKPCMTKQEWLDAIDAAILASKPTAVEVKS